MSKVNFHKQINFFQLSCFIKEKNLNHSDILKQAYKAGAIRDENQKFLYNFIKSIGKTDDIKSQLYQKPILLQIVSRQFPVRTIYLFLLQLRILLIRLFSQILHQ